MGPVYSAALQHALDKVFPYVLLHLPALQFLFRLMVKQEGAWIIRPSHITVAQGYVYTAVGRLPPSLARLNYTSFA